MNQIYADKRARTIAALNEPKDECRFAWHWVVTAFLAGALLVMTIMAE